MRRLTLVLTLVALLTLLAPTEAWSEEATSSSLTSCWASTPCLNGRVIRCEVFSNPYYGQRCTWFVAPYQVVECRGWDLFGNWVVVGDRCW